MTLDSGDAKLNCFSLNTTGVSIADLTLVVILVCWKYHLFACLILPGVWGINRKKTNYIPMFDWIIAV